MIPLDPAAAAFVSGVVAQARSRCHDARCVTLQIAGDVICIRFQTERLYSLFSRAFVVTQPDGQSAPDLIIHVAEGEPFPSPAWRADAYRSCGEIVGFAGDALYLHVDLPLATLSALDLAAGEGAYWIRSAECVPSYERSAPFRPLLHRWLMRRRMPLAHVAAVARGSNAALIVGQKGAGKSTTSLACLAAGLDFLGDDRCAIDISGPEPLVWNVYSSVKIYSEELSRFGIEGLKAHAISPTTNDDRKHLAFVQDIVPGQLRQYAPVRCMIHPRPTGACTSRFVPTPRGEVARILTSDLLGRSPATAPYALRTIAKLCSAVPCYRLDASHDLAEVAAAIGAMLDAMSGFPPHSS